MARGNRGGRGDNRGNGNGRGRGGGRGGRGRGRGRGGFVYGPRGSGFDDFDDDFVIANGEVVPQSFNAPRGGRGRGRGPRGVYSPAPSRGTSTPRGTSYASPLRGTGSNKRGGRDDLGPKDRLRQKMLDKKLKTGTAPLSQLLFEDRPFLRPIVFVRSSITPSLFMDEEEIFEPGVEGADEQEKSHVPTADAVSRVFHIPLDNANDDDEEELQEIDFADLGEAVAEIEVLAATQQTQRTTGAPSTEETFTGFYVDSVGSRNKEKEGRIEVERAVGVPLGREEDEEVIVYVAPHPRGGAGASARVEEVEDVAMRAASAPSLPFDEVVAPETTTKSPTPPPPPSTIAVSLNSDAHTAQDGTVSTTMQNEVEVEMADVASTALPSPSDAHPTPADEATATVEVYVEMADIASPAAPIAPDTDALPTPTQPTALSPPDVRTDQDQDAPTPTPAIEDAMAVEEPSRAGIESASASVAVEASTSSAPAPTAPTPQIDSISFSFAQPTTATTTSTISSPPYPAPSPGPSTSPSALTHTLTPRRTPHRPRSLLHQRPVGGSARRKLAKHPLFGSFGTMLSERREGAERVGERRRGEDIDWGDDGGGEDEEGEENDMEVDGVVDVKGMERFVRSMGVDGQREMGMGDVEDEERMRVEDEESEGGTEDSGSSSDEDDEEEEEVEEVVGREETRLVAEAGDAVPASDEEDESSDDSSSFESRLRKLRERSQPKSASKSKSKGKQRQFALDSDDDDFDPDFDIGWDGSEGEGDKDREIARVIEEYLLENAEILGGRDRKARNAMFRQVYKGEFEMPDGPAPRKKDKGKHLPPDLAAQWQRDREKKAERRRARELERLIAASDPLVRKKGGKKARKALRASIQADSPASSDLMPNRVFDVNSLEIQIRRFVDDLGSQGTMALPPMEKHARKVVHELATAFGLKNEPDGGEG
ncbi:unnamed protein product [Peniophora sp. CBMAI 1063]|nr:unnamed protein product [Peniophora sp. CBMAI 1063]